MTLQVHWNGWEDPSGHSCPPQPQLRGIRMGGVLTWFRGLELKITVYMTLNRSIGQSCTTQRSKLSLSRALCFGKCLLFVSHKYNCCSYNGWQVYKYTHGAAPWSSTVTYYYCRDILVQKLCSTVAWWALRYSQWTRPVINYYWLRTIFIFISIYTYMRTVPVSTSIQEVANINKVSLISAVNKRYFIFL